MGADPDDRSTPPDPSQNDEVYIENEEGEPRMAGLTGDNEGVYRGYPDDVRRVVDSKLAAALLIVGGILLVFPEPITSMLGLLLLLVGAFLGLIQLLSP